MTPYRHRLIPALSSAIAVALLAACGGTPGRGSPDRPAPAIEASPLPSSPPRKPAVVQKRGGGYYKDDGPGDDIPENLDEIPDAEPRVEPLHRFANRPYIVFGKAYTPDTRVRPFRQRGIASWYGKKFHGQKTSTGETYDMFAMTAAHPTLAIPSYVRVTNTGNGKSVVVRVIDRGPFHAERIIDLSYAAAHRLGYINQGSTPVEVESILADESRPQVLAARPSVTPARPALPVLAEAERDEIELLAARLAASEPATAQAAESATPPRTASGRNEIYLQLGAFSNLDNAESFRAHVSRELDWVSERIQTVSARGIFRVHLGPYASRAEGEKVAERIRQSFGTKPVFVLR